MSRLPKSGRPGRPRRNQEPATPHIPGQPRRPRLKQLRDRGRAGRQVSAGAAALRVPRATQWAGDIRALPTASCTCPAALLAGGTRARGEARRRGGGAHAARLPFPPPHSPAGPAAAAARAQRRSQSRRVRVPSSGDAKDSGGRTPLHSAAAGSQRRETREGEPTAPAPSAGRGAADPPRPPPGERGRD